MTVRGQLRSGRNGSSLLSIRGQKKKREGEGGERSNLEKREKIVSRDAYDEERVEWKRSAPG